MRPSRGAPRHPAWRSFRNSFFLALAEIGPLTAPSDFRQTFAAAPVTVDSVLIDSNRLYDIIEGCDERFDGWVYVGVTSTGIYCRPSCPARTPKREYMRFYPSAAAAQGAGFRACKRCRPDATPGSPEWDRRADLVGRAMRLIADGVVDREGVTGLASRLGYTERHVHRQLVAVAGAGPLALARAQRAQTARVLLETTDVPITPIAFAAGFRSVRQFNATIREVFALTPGELRTRAKRHGRAQDSGAVVLRLPYRAPLDADDLIAFLALRAVPGIEEVLDGAYRRSLRLPHGFGTVELTPAGDHMQARFVLDDLRDLAAAMQRSRALLDLDSDPQAIIEALGVRRGHRRARPRRARSSRARATSTATSSPRARSSASRCRSPARRPSPVGSSRRSASRSSARSAP